MSSEVKSWDPRVDDFNDQNCSTIRGGPASSYVRQPHADKLQHGFALHIVNIPCSMTKGDLSNHLSVQNIVVLDVNILPRKENFKSNHAIVKVEDAKQGIHIIDSFDKKPPLYLGISKARAPNNNNNNVDNQQGGFQAMRPTPIVPPAELQPKNVRRPNKVYRDNKPHEINSNSSESAIKINPLSNENGVPSQNCLDSTVLEKPLNVESVKANLEERFNDMHINYVDCKPKTNRSTMNSTANVATISTASSVCSSSSRKKQRRIMNCVFCSGKGKMRCSICFAYYCSTSCQMDDWYGHQDKCRSPPQLLPVNDEFSDEQSNVGIESRKSVDPGINLKNTISPSPSIHISSHESPLSPNVSAISIPPLDLSSAKLVELMSENVEMKKFHFNRLNKFPLEEQKCYKVQPVFYDQDLYVRLCSDQIDDDTCKFFDTLEAFFEKHANPMPSELVPGELFCVFDSSEGRYYRAQVVNLKEEKILAYYVDYGESDLVSMEKARIFDASFLELPVYCYRLQNLKSCDGIHSIESIYKDLFYFTMKVLSTDPLVVDLLNFDGRLMLTSRDIPGVKPQKKFQAMSNNVSSPPRNNPIKHTESLKKSTSSNAISNKLSTPKSVSDNSLQEKSEVLHSPVSNSNKEKQAQLSPEKHVPSSEGSKCSELYTKTYDETPTLSLPIEKEVSGFIIHNGSVPIINVIPQKHISLLEKLTEISEDMQEYCNMTAKFYKPKENEIVLARYDKDNQWYRAAVMGVSDASAVVVFIDFGNMSEVVDFSQFCPMIQKYMELPVLAVNCQIDNLPDTINTQQKDALMEVLNDEVLLDVKSFQDFMYTVSIPSLQSTFNEILTKYV